MQPLDVAGVEGGRHGAQRLELVADQVQVARLEHRGVRRGRKRVVREDVPAAELDVIEAVQRYEVLDLGHAILGPFTEADGAELGQRSHGCGEPFSGQHDTGDRGRCDRSHPWKQDGELAVRCADLVGVFHRLNSNLVGSRGLRSCAGKRISV
jgi:hypothetical protein